MIDTFGTLIPFFSPSSPPLITRQTISVPVVSCTSKQIRPSSIRICPPAVTSCGSPLYVMETRSLSPSTSLVVRTNVWFSFNVTFLWSFSSPVRISGPFVSSRMATGTFSSLRTSFKRSIRIFCSSWSPWEKLKRATSMPFSTSFFIISFEFVFGPIVQTILVFLMLYSPAFLLKYCPASSLCYA